MLLPLASDTRWYPLKVDHRANGTVRGSYEAGPLRSLSVLGPVRRFGFLHDDQGWLVQISELGPAGSVSALSDRERSLVAGEEVAAGQWRLPLPESTQAVMIRLGDRWIPRWWERP